MKMKFLLFISLILILANGCSTNQLNTDLQKNKGIAAKYHNLNPSDIDVILTENFIGRNEKSRFTWNRENHRNYLSNGKFKTDSIFSQIAEGNWVATRFVRTMELNGDTVKIEAMHFKRFENGKIAEIWEYTDTKQVETEGK